jgi:carboxymethylenebutenolidase
MGDHDRSRREFIGSTAAAGLMAVAGTAAAAPPAVVEKDVQVRTADGDCDAAFFHPDKGAHPGVLLWTDIFGLRPAFRELGRRLAASGFAVLVPNPFYRSAKAPVFGDISTFNFQSETDRARFPPLVGPLTAAGAVERDAHAYVAFLDAQPAVNRAKPLGVQGYCMSGPLMLRCAAAVPERFGAGASFHGGGLVTDKPDSAHLLIPKIKAQLYIAIAANDDARAPNDKNTLRAACAAARVRAEIEVYAGAQHGWCVPDMPAQNGQAIYDKIAAERAWTHLLRLYRSALS